MRLFLFDIDGTLIIARGAGREAFHRALRAVYGTVGPGEATYDFRGKTDPRILNYLGYSHRKAGRVTVGLGYYQVALRHNPDYTLVREYMGEAYLQQGNVEAAKEQLTEIEKRCGKGCEEYAELAKQIDDYLKG